MKPREAIRVHILHEDTMEKKRTLAEIFRAVDRGTALYFRWHLDCENSGEAEELLKLIKGWQKRIYDQIGQKVPGRQIADLDTQMELDPASARLLGVFEAELARRGADVYPTPSDPNHPLH